MIKLKLMEWSNAFSYGTNNSIDFSACNLTQLVGKNGHGKSSIALILEEVLYNKNSKNVKRADILNRNSSAKSYTISLTFSKDSDEYSIHTSRGSTQTVKLWKNGVDISAHTATSTYKLIEEIIGFDHKTFTQIVYQSSSYNLEFLTATDTNRKKFFIDLLNLSVYTRASELFKVISKDLSQEIDAINLKISMLVDWEKKLNKEDLKVRERLSVPDESSGKAGLLSELKDQLYNIDHTNKRVTQNNTYKKMFESLDITPVPPVEENIVKIHEDYTNKLARKKELARLITVVDTTCKSCGQAIDASAKLAIVKEATRELGLLEPEIEKVTKLYDRVKKETEEYSAYKQRSVEWERLYLLVDKDMGSTTLDRASLEKSIDTLNSEIRLIKLEITKAQNHNLTVDTHNAKVVVLKEQLSKVSTELLEHRKEYSALAERINPIQLLVKTFSTTGLIAYKIECLVKDLESLTNEYLLDMSDGRFQISFQVNSSDKLNVVINDNGRDIDILALSNGERARVNVATLLAIRKLMQSLSNSRINLLILDETIESLDVDGKDKLVEVLLKEEYLNTIVVSHGFSHPLLEKLSVVKENNISRIE